MPPCRREGKEQPRSGWGKSHTHKGKSEPSLHVAKFDLISFSSFQPHLFIEHHSFRCYAIIVPPDFDTMFIVTIRNEPSTRQRRNRAIMALWSVFARYRPTARYRRVGGGYREQQKRCVRRKKPYPMLACMRVAAWLADEVGDRVVCSLCCPLIFCLVSAMLSDAVCARSPQDPGKMAGNPRFGSSIFLMLAHL